MIVSVTGVGGTGKTTSSRILVKILEKSGNGYKLVELNELAEEKQIYSGYDEERKSKIVDTQKMGKEVEKLGEKHGNIIMEGLFSHIFESDIVIVLRCRPDVLKNRLEKKYDWHTKIDENMDAEMINLITEESISAHGKENVFEIDTSDREPVETARKMKDIILDKNDSRSKYIAGNIDWLSDD